MFDWCFVHLLQKVHSLFPQFLRVCFVCRGSVVVELSLQLVFVQDVIGFVSYEQRDVFLDFLVRFRVRKEGQALVQVVLGILDNNARPFVCLFDSSTPVSPQHEQGLFVQGRHVQPLGFRHFSTYFRCILKLAFDLCEVFLHDGW